MPPRHQTSFQIAVIGSGPAGLATAGQAADRGLSCVVLERADHLADTIHCYQKRKLVMAEPSLVPQRGDLPFDVGPRESVLDGWQRYVAEKDLDVRFGHEVSELSRGGNGYRLATPRGTFDAEKVVIAIGTQGNPRQLGVPGEDAPHVHDRLVDPDAHRDEEIVVVGAGDSALEVALALCERNRVHLIVRSAEIVRAKEALERDALTRASNDEMRIHYSSSVNAIGDGWVELQGPEGVVRVPAGRLIKKIGADPPRRLLEGWGVEFDGPGRDARPKLRVGYESASLPGVHLIGAVTGRDLIRLGINQGWEVVEHISGNPVEPADENLLKERLPFWRGTVRERIEEIREALPVFAGASIDQLRETFLLVEPRELQDGEVLIRQNDYTDDFLAIVDGKLRVTRREEGLKKGRADGGSERLVAEVGGGSFLGEMGLISGRRRNASATSLGTSRVLEVPRKAMLKLLRLAPAVKEAVDRVFLVRALGNVLGTAVQSELWRLAGRARLVQLKKDETIFQEGDESDALYLIRQGMVKLTRSSGDREVVLTYLVAGNYFGESALFGDRPRTATVSAIFPTELVALERDDFLEFLAGRPEDVRRRLVEGLEERQLASLRSESVPGVGEVLSQLIESEAVIGTDVLLIDNHKCVRCGNCLDACEAVHADGQARLTLHGDHVANLLLPNSCMQCENPLCMLDCPPDAIFRRPEGEIFIRDSCIGCGNCATNCPYDNIFMVQPKEKSSVIDWVKGLFAGGDEGNGNGKKVTTPPTEGGELGVKQELAVKCDLCRDLRGGPACVRSCPTGAAIRLEPETPDDLRRDVEEMVDPGALL